MIQWSQGNGTLYDTSKFCGGLWGEEKRAFEKKVRDTVDGRNPANQLISSLSVYPSLSHYLQGFDTSQVVQDFIHQQ